MQAENKIDTEKVLLLIESQRKMTEIYTAAGKFNASEHKKLPNAVRELREKWCSTFPDHKHLNNETFSNLENVCSSGIVGTQKGFNIVKTFYDLMNETVFAMLYDLLTNIYEDEEFIEELFKFCSESPKCKSLTIFIVYLIQKICMESERKKFDFLMGIVEKYPSLFSGKDMIHPQYEYKPSAQCTFEKCPICGGTGEPYHCAFSYRMSTFDYPFQPFKLWMRCGSCKNLYSEQFPEEFLKLSTHQREIVPSENHEAAVSDIANANIMSIWSDILNKLRRYTNKKALLEVGIGNGELLSVALEMGYEPNAVEIVEESAQNVSDILGIPIHCGDFLNFKPNKIFPIIIMGDVIEHVTDPEAALKNAYDLLENDGVLWLSTPNFESSFTRLKKFTDAMWLEPYHITYFNYSGLEALLKKCGFEVKEYSVSKRYNGSMELVITKKQ